MQLIKSVPVLLMLLLLCCTESKAKPTEQFLEYDEKTKDWYQKKYGEPITKFELSAKSIFYEYNYFSNFEGKGMFSVLVTRTAAGAIATVKEKTNRKKTELNLKLNMEEWVDFIRILSKLRFEEWEEV